MALLELEFPDEDAVFIPELLGRLPGVRIRPPATEQEAAARPRLPRGYGGG